jgi:hypothetical protein
MAPEPTEAKPMTLTRWWLAGLLALTLGVGASWGQCGQGPSKSCGGTGATRAPYYNEVADILFPPTSNKCSGSDEDLWKTLATPAAPSQAEQERCALANDPASQHRLQAAYFYLRVGHPGAAEYYARLVCHTYPTCQEARRLLALAYACRTRNAVGGSEACEEPVPPGTDSTCAGASAVCQGCRECPQGQPSCGGCAAKGCCATNCRCNKEGGCGPDCCCGMSSPATGGQRVPELRLSVIYSIHGVGTRLDGNAPAPATANKVTPPNAVPACKVELTTGNQAIRIVSGSFEVSCDQLRYVGGDRVLLQGNSCVMIRKGGQPERIVADRILLNLQDGAYEVNPEGVQVPVVPARGFNPAAHPE